jgi:AcrR family transcriptional regulator
MSPSQAVAEAARSARGKRSARDRILDAAIDRIASDGIDEVRIARIAMDAGVSTSLVHYHFSTREALLGEALEHSYEVAGSARIGEEEAAGLTPVERLAGVIDGSLPYPGMLERDWILWVELWLRAARSPELRETSARLYRRMHEWIRDEIANGIAAGVFAAVDPDELADRALAMIDGFGIRALVGDPEVTLERAREQIWWLLASELGIDAEVPPRRSQESE